MVIFPIHTLLVTAQNHKLGGTTAFQIASKGAVAHCLIVLALFSYFWPFEEIVCSATRIKHNTCFNTSCKSCSKELYRAITDLNDEPRQY